MFLDLFRATWAAIKENRIAFVIIAMVLTFVSAIAVISAYRYNHLCDGQPAGARITREFCVRDEFHNCTTNTSRPQIECERLAENRCLIRVCQ